MLCVSLATPGTQACDAVGGALRPLRREWPAIVGREHLPSSEETAGATGDVVGHFRTPGSYSRPNFLAKGSSIYFVIRVFPKTGWAPAIILCFLLSSGSPTSSQTPLNASGIVLDEHGN